MDIRESYNFWCESPYFDEDTKAELKNISDNACIFGKHVVR